MQFASVAPPATLLPIMAQTPYCRPGSQQCFLPNVHSMPPSWRPAQHINQHMSGRSLVIAAADASVRVKLGMAAERLTLDLSECDLLQVPPETFDITGLEASRVCNTFFCMVLRARSCENAKASCCACTGPLEIVS